MLSRLSDDASSGLTASFTTTNNAGEPYLDVRNALVDTDELADLEARRQTPHQIGSFLVWRNLLLIDLSFLMCSAAARKSSRGARSLGIGLSFRRSG
jgi:hypothetical protein